jgi:hypothetical protein
MFGTKPQPLWGGAEARRRFPRVAEYDNPGLEGATPSGSKDEGDFMRESSGPGRPGNHASNGRQCPLRQGRHQLVL